VSKSSSRLKQIYDRDNGICHICTKPVSLELGEGSRDHIIPVSIEKSSAGNLENQALAHRKCNRVRGNRLMTEGEWFTCPQCSIENFGWAKQKPNKQGIMSEPFFVCEYCKIRIYREDNVGNTG
jgi:hypothetical protein